MGRSLSIAIDGPAAAGKSTVAKLVAKKLGYTYIDTGAMYRALTLKALNEQISLENEQQLVTLLTNIDIKLHQSNDGQQVLLNGKDVTLAIRSEDVTNHVSQVAKHAKVRKKMVKHQQALAQQKGVVMDGRDIGTYVLPDAEVKIFLIASVTERAKRRHEENLQKGFQSSFTELVTQIKQRDLMDSQRKVAPLVKAEDAVEIDTTSMSIEEVVVAILTEVSKIS